jgi:hypothetical protein
MEDAMPTCSGPGHNGRCGRPARAHGKCPTHYQQQRRGRPLTVIVERGRDARVALPALRVSPRCMAALEAKGPSPYAAAVAVLERWARRQEEMRHG